MNEIRLGALAPKGAGRDAIHIAVAPVIAADTLLPGQHVGLVNGSVNRVTHSAETKIGIVDPYLPGRIFEEQRFWLCLYPYTVTSLRHVWTHPAFPATAEHNAAYPSEAWIRNFAERVGLSYAQVMAGAAGWVRDREYLCFFDLLEGESVPDEFWTHYEIVTGETVDNHDRGSFFTCSC